MILLQRYCLKELVIPFLASIFIITFIFMGGKFFVNLADLLVNKGVSIWDVVKLLILMIPSFMGFILPVAALTSVLLVFGSLAQNNEITAMKASGINLFQLLTPVIAAAFLLSFVSLFVVDQIQPRSEYQSRQLVRELVVKRPAAYLEAGRFIKDFQGYSIWINHIEGNKIRGINILQFDEGKPTRTIIAEHGEVFAGEDQQTLSLKLFNGTSDQPNPDDENVLYKLNFKTFLLTNIQVGKQRGGINKKEKEMTIDELIYQLNTNDEVSRDKKKQRQIKAEIHKKISFSFATIAFVIIGLPAAIMSRRGEAIVSFGFAMAVAGIYYILFILGRTIALNGYLPAWLALWLPNTIPIGTGIFLWKRMVQL